MSTTKEAIVNDVADAMGLRRTIIAEAFDQFLAVICARLAQARRGSEISIQIRGFGTLRTSYHGGRPGYNMHTRERLQLPGARWVHFKPAPALRAKFKEALHATD